MSDESAGARATIVSLVGVYHADGGVRGELAYLIGKLRGSAHCGLCDVTHGTVSTKAAWRELTTRLPVPFELRHLNEREEAVRAASEGHTPCVLALTADGAARRVLGSAELDRLDGDVGAFDRALHDAVPRHGLRWPAAAPG